MICIWFWTQNELVHMQMTLNQEPIDPHASNASEKIKDRKMNNDKKTVGSLLVLIAIWSKTSNFN